MTGRTTAQTAVVYYQSPSVERSRIVLLYATAALFVFSPLPLICWIFGIQTHGVWTSLQLALPILALLFFGFAVKYYKINGNTRLVFSESGIGLPAAFYGGFSSDIHLCPWSELEFISVLQDSKDRETLLLSMKRRSIRLRLASLSADDLDKLVSSCLLWSDANCRDESFIELAEKVTSKRLDNSDNTFTGLWMQEAGRRLRATPFTPLNPATKLQGERIKVLQAVAAGGWSAVYLCEWQGKTAAILKEAVVPPSVEEKLKKKAYEQFEREALLLSGINHPQIAKILDYFVENGRQYMVLQRVPGPNLRTYIKDKGAVSERQAIKWGKEICSILSFLHSRLPPIVHRDLTPENLVLDMRASIVLIDFGSANEFIGTVTGTLVGKPSYVSPEQFSGHATLKSDLYSLGAVLYFMLTGEDPEPLAVAHLKGEQSRINDKLDRLVSDLMQLKVADRIDSAEEVKTRLEEIEATSAYI